MPQTIILSSNEIAPRRAMEKSNSLQGVSARMSSFAATCLEASRGPMRRPTHLRLVSRRTPWKDKDKGFKIRIMILAYLMLRQSGNWIASCLIGTNQLCGAPANSNSEQQVTSRTHNACNRRPNLQIDSRSIEHEDITVVSIPSSRSPQVARVKP